MLVEFRTCWACRPRDLGFSVGCRDLWIWLCWAWRTSVFRGLDLRV